MNGKSVSHWILISEKSRESSKSKSFDKKNACLLLSILHAHAQNIIWIHVQCNAMKTNIYIVTVYVFAIMTELFFHHSNSDDFVVFCCYYECRILIREYIFHGAVQSCNGVMHTMFQLEISWIYVINPNDTSSCHFYEILLYWSWYWIQLIPIWRIKFNTLKTVKKNRSGKGEEKIMEHWRARYICKECGWKYEKINRCKGSSSFCLKCRTANSLFEEVCVVNDINLRPLVLVKQKKSLFSNYRI